MKLDEFLSRLTKVKKTGNGWIACCPAHDDKSPSLTVGIGKGGGVIAHCFGGCDIADVVAAVGMTLSDLMPETAPDRPYSRQRLPAMDVLRALRFHATMTAIVASDIANDRPITQETKDTMMETAAAIHEAYSMVEA